MVLVFYLGGAWLLQNFSLFVWMWENTFGHFAFKFRWIKVYRILLVFDLHQIKLVVGLLHQLFPILILVIVS